MFRFQIRSCIQKKKKYGCECDWFSLGVMMYELCEGRYPYGDRPKYEDLNEEYVQPELLGDDGVTEVPELFDLLAGLLDWSPEARLVGDELKEHLYWNPNGKPVDWEIIEERKMPSPLLPIARERMDNVAAMEREAEAGGTGSFARRRMSVTTAEVAMELSRAAAEQASVDEMNENDDMSFESRKSKSEKQKLYELENEMRVEDWEFNSHHAIAAEYLESHEDLFSVM